MTVNGAGPDENGDVKVDLSGIGALAGEVKRLDEAKVSKAAFAGVAAPAAALSSLKAAVTSIINILKGQEP